MKRRVGNIIYEHTKQRFKDMLSQARIWQRASKQVEKTREEVEGLEDPSVPTSTHPQPSTSRERRDPSESEPEGSQPESEDFEEAAIGRGVKRRRGPLAPGKTRADSPRPKSLWPEGPHKKARPPSPLPGPSGLTSRHKKTQRKSSPAGEDASLESILKEYFRKKTIQKTTPKGKGRGKNRPPQ